jgi:hypothetical protein
MRDSQTRRSYWVALWLTVIICVAELVSLPVVVTFDGYWYAKLAEILGTARFGAEWDYLRTPLFPALLKLFFWLFGRQPLAVSALQMALGFSGIWLLGAALMRTHRTLEAAIVLPLLALFPTLVTYEHALLTEVGTFAFMALLLYVVTAPISRPEWRVAGIAGVLALGYYYRASFLYISPVVALVYAVGALQQRAADCPPELRTHPRIVAGSLVVMLAPVLIAYPWQSNPRVSLRNADVLLYGLVKQAVVPASDPLWSNAQTLYTEAIDRSLNRGEFPLGGVKDELVYAPVESLHDYAPHATSVLVRAVLRYPRRYIAGCVRTALLFTEMYMPESDNAVFRDAVLSGGGSVLTPHPPGFPPLDTEMAQRPNPSRFGHFLIAIAPLYDRLVCCGLLATLVLVVVGFWRRDGATLAFGLIPVAFLLLNIALLTSQDRTAAPVYPILLVNLVSLPRLLGAGSLRGRLKSLKRGAAGSKSGPLARSHSRGGAHRSGSSAPTARNTPKDRR